MEENEWDESIKGLKSVWQENAVNFEQDTGLYGLLLWLTF